MAKRKPSGHDTMPSDRAPYTPGTDRTMAKGLHIVAAVPPWTDEHVSDIQRGLTRMAAVCGWTVEESREVWRALGVDRRVA